MTADRFLRVGGGVYYWSVTADVQRQDSPVAAQGASKADGISDLLPVDLEDLLLPPAPVEKKRKRIQDACLPPIRRDSEAEKRLRLPKPHPPEALVDCMRIRKSVLREIKATIGSRPAESGGMLLSESRDYTITGFVFDEKGSTTRSFYGPDVDFLNSHLEGEAADTFVGIVHAHPAGYTRPSEQDLRAAWSNMTSPGNPHLQAYLMPIIQTFPDCGIFQFIPYIILCDPAGMGQVICKQVELDVF